MDKKQLLILILLAAAAMFVLPKFLAPREQPAEAPTTTVERRPALPGPAGQWFLEGRAFPIDQPAPKVVLGGLDPNASEPFLFQVELDPRGASISSAKLAGIYDTVQHKRTEPKTPEQLQEWSYELLAPVRGGLTEFIYPMSTRRLSVAGLADVLVDYARPGIGWRAGAVEVLPDGSERVAFTMDVWREAGQGPDEQAEQHYFRLTKTYTVTPGSPSLRVSLRIENRTDQTQRFALEQHGPVGLPREDIRSDLRTAMYARYFPGQREINVPRTFGESDIRNAAVGTEEAMGTNADADPVVWTGLTNKFFAALLYPMPEGVTADAIPADRADLVVPAEQIPYTFLRRVVAERPGELTQMVLVQTGEIDLAAGDSQDFHYDLYLGPKNRQLFSDIPLYAALDYTDSIQFGGCAWCTFTWLALGIMWIIEAGGAAIGNYGIMIILLVLFIRLVLHPITKKSQVSMMKLGKLGPEMEKIKAKYKDDKEAQNRATMQFMKEQGASPILGCLPMLLQMPIWVALWSGLQASAVLRHEGLLPFWITDLAAPDALISWAQTPVNLPLIGAMTGPIISLNLLPILLALFMYLQQKLMPMSAAAVTASPEQRQQQKIMQIFMTGFMLLIFYNAPSGLTLYIMASTGGGVLESYVIRKHIKEREAAEAAAETRVSVPGKAPRGARPKKPKGPNWFKHG